MSVDALRGFDMFWIVGGDFLVRSLPLSGAKATGSRPCIATLVAALLTLSVVALFNTIADKIKAINGSL